jgi:hypothetical protein
MKTLKNLACSENSTRDLTSKKPGIGKLLVSILIIVAFSCLTLLPSCYAVFRVPGPEHRGHFEGHGHGEHHD